ncbi:MAG: hypothetical protein LBG31_04775 [Prevotellaceae bacterium]|jgi:hypothetical protein|nr:hypothetical protein [Prevotellaceae bacterium]
MANNILTYTINLNGNATQGILSISKAAKTANTSMAKLERSAHLVANIGFAYQHAMAVVGKFTAAMDKCVKAYEMQAVAEKKLETLMRNNIGATDAQIQSIKDLTAAQQKLGVIGDEIQLAGAQELSTYLTKTEHLQKLIPAMNDMLAQQYGLNASQEQAVTIAQMMGKVLDGQVGALSRYGYRFDEAQEKVLKFGTEEQKVTMLSGILQKYVGGVNAALAATPEGKWKQHQNNVGDLRERIGGLFVAIRDALFPAFEAISNIVQRLTAYFEEHKQAIMGVAETVGNILSGAFNVVGGAIMFVVEHWKAFTAAIVAWKVVTILSMSHFAKLRLLAMAHTKALNFCTGATNLFTAASKKLKLAFDALSRHPWLIAITAAIGITVALVSAFRKFNKEQNAARDAVNSVAAKIGVEQYNLNKLFDAMKKTYPESEKRKTLIDKLNAQYPGLLKNQNLLKGSIEDITKAQEDANKALADNIFLQAYKEKVEKLEKKVNDKRFELFNYAEGLETVPSELIPSIYNIISEEAAKQKTVTYKGVSGAQTALAVDDRITSLSRRMQELLGDIQAGELYKLAIGIFYNEAEKNKTLAALRRFGKSLGISDDLMDFANGGLLPGGDGSGTNPLGGTSEAIATGGTRNTTVNIHLGKMQAAEQITFSGGMSENIGDIRRLVEQEMSQVLGMAETAA